MNPFLIAGSVLILAAVLMFNAGDWTDNRMLRWLALALALAAGWPAYIYRQDPVRWWATIFAAAIGGFLITLAFISQKTGMGWVEIIMEMCRRQDDRKDRAKARRRGRRNLQAGQ